MPPSSRRHESAAAGLSGVIVQLGELTHAEAAPLQRRASAWPVALIREIVDSLDGLLRERGVAAASPGPRRSRHRRPGQVTRALRNLLTNAVQHSPPGATVRIGVAEGATVEIRIADEGPGIAEEDRPYVFERFYRADRSRGRTPGAESA